jgi:hypothetical protein
MPFGCTTLTRYPTLKTLKKEATAAETTALTSEQTASDALAAQNNAWVVDFATAQLSCLPKTDTAHVRLVYKPI